jgi:capsular exopolysaccharide synthesis family protein
MSRLYETLRRMEMQRGKADPAQAAPLEPIDLVKTAMVEPADLAASPTAEAEISSKSRLVAFTDPRGLGAEKFRALVTRLEHQRKERELRSMQITSAIGSEGKTLVAGNLALTLAKQTDSRVLLVEGDLHLPTLASLFGLNRLKGIGDWWSAGEEKDTISQYVYNLGEIPLWLLPAGKLCDQPSQILQSARMAQAFVRLVSSFDWVVVDSAPILPLIDANLWSRLVDGTILVVREGVTPVRALEKSVASLDDPKFIGVILNEASEFDHTNYADQYYALDKR